jgi:Zn-dependent M28 family amino/carboxypeptidase
MAANDGASGVAVMLELARLLQQHDSARVAVDFVCFDAEDWGVPQWSDEVDADSWALGAQHWAASYASAPVPAASTAGESHPSYDYAILLDMVGGQGAKFYHEYYSLQYARPVVEKVWQAASAAGYGSFFPSKDGGGVTDDHIPVNEKAHIPCIDIINHYPDCEQSSFGPTWHTVNDDMQHLDKNTLQAVGQTLVQLIYSD